VAREIFIVAQIMIVLGSKEGVMYMMMNGTMGLAFTQMPEVRGAFLCGLLHNT